MRVLVIGCGSIGLRHARLAEEAGHTVLCLTQRNDLGLPCVTSLDRACEQAPFDLVVIATSTAQHADSLGELIIRQPAKRILVEKPLFAWEHQTPKLDEDVRRTTFVAYNLRFHPAVQRLREVLRGRRLFHISLYAGQYLPDWRPGTDYRASYSAISAQGGGVLRDLSHELDLACLLAGKWQAAAALGGHCSDLQIDGEDVFTLLTTHEHCPSVTIHVNYLDRAPRREIVVQDNMGGARLDLIRSTLSFGEHTEHFPVERDTTYAAQLQELQLETPAQACTFQEGLDVLRLLEAAEEANTKRNWVYA